MLSSTTSGKVKPSGFKGLKEKYKKTYRTLTTVTFLWRLVRTATLGFGIYSAGRMVGIAEYAKDPRDMEKQLTRQLLMGCAFEADESGNPKQPELLRLSHPTHKRVEDVGDRIVKAARVLSEAKIKSRLERLKNFKIGKDGDISDRKTIEAELKHWEKNRKMCKGTWTYLVVKSPVPNAFVSDLTPRKIFVHSSIVESLKASDDELAMILGHEISHLLHGHTAQRHRNQMTGNIILLVLLSALDATGLFTLFALPFTNYLQRLMTSANSREHEEEADITGLKIAALACYNTHAGPEIFGKLAKMSGRDGEDAIAGWTDTHPLPMDRLKNLKEKSTEINCDNVGHCHGFLERYMEARRLGMKRHYSESVGHLTKD
ncbi:hypothetical protein TrST_g4413 [Triparma strigata]|uniref:Peptidase M48 domain-containing protein n=1 Tax=Triparma strigata TaxID=1606541 RepID=A0A9W7E8B2_9STRA|nr:hypothetical protein TrST_g4413 [Triparma strigata]